MISQLLLGFGYFLKGFKRLLDSGNKRYVVIPVMLSIILFLLGGVAGYQLLINKLVSLVPDNLAWLEWIIVPMYVLASLVIMFFLFIVMTNLVAGPFNSLLSEKIIKRNNAPTPRQSLYDERKMMNIIKFLYYESNKLLYSLSFLFLSLLLIIIPGINIIGAILSTAIGIWILLTEFLSYPAEYYGLTPKLTRKTIKQNLPLCVGFGAGSLILMLIPFVNLLAIPVSVVGATYLWFEQIEQRNDIPKD